MAQEFFDRQSPGDHWTAELLDVGRRLLCLLYVDTGRLCSGPNGAIVLPLFSLPRYHFSMSDDPDPLCRATSEDVADALAFALRFQGRKRVHNADEIMSEIVARRLVEHLERSGFVVMKRPPIEGGAPIGRGFEGR